ncbi:MAG: hypothetical protein IPJ73_03960 [Zoogloea sp.]|nr:hypothetical protein [Zoogloea sp.]
MATASIWKSSATAPSSRRRPAIIGMLVDITARRLRAAGKTHRQRTGSTHRAGSSGGHPQPLFFKDEKARYLGATRPSALHHAPRDTIIGRSVFDIRPRAGGPLP